MASVSSLDKDLRKLRLDKYTPAAANEVRSWIENILGERLPPGDLLESLKDGTALCKLVNLAVPSPGVRYKQSAMPFVQMENISLFLRACQAPPLNLHQHDVFLTVDLYEQKDPAQVLQCLGAFSRAAHAANPSRFPSSIGPRAAGAARSGVMSPQSTGPTSPRRGRNTSVASNTSSAYNSAAVQSRSAMAPTRTGDSGGRWSPTKSPTNGSTSPGPAVSSWSRREHEGSTAPAWNIAQYGYMGGASQGNLGIAFGGRRQITSASPHVPSLAEKERLRKEKAAEEEKRRQEAEEEDRRRRAEIEAEEERARVEEERRWEEETRRARDEEMRKVEEEKRRWEEEERMWKITEEKRRKEEEEAEARLEKERRRARSRSRSALKGQYLSQYQAEHGAGLAETAGEESGGYRGRVRELEKELELARERERAYERERQRSMNPRDVDDPSASIPGPTDKRARSRARSRSRPRPPSRQDSWSRDQREFLTVSPQPQQRHFPPKGPPPQHQPFPAQAPSPPQQQSVPAPRPLPDPTAGGPAPKVRTHNTGGRPLPDPAAYAAATSPPAPQHATIPHPVAHPVAHPAAPKPAPKPASMNRTDRYLASNPAPQPAAPQATYSRELDATSERDAEDRRRAQKQTGTKAGGWASKSLLEREMEMERQRQREWEEAQRETAKAPRGEDSGVDGIGGGIGGRWDVGQWAGYTGGDSQNKVGTGIGAGRRPIVGPRPLPGPPGGR